MGINLSINMEALPQASSGFKGRWVCGGCAADLRSSPIQMRTSRRWAGPPGDRGQGALSGGEHPLLLWGSVGGQREEPRKTGLLTAINAWLPLSPSLGEVRRTRQDSTALTARAQSWGHGWWAGPGSWVDGPHPSGSPSVTRDEAGWGPGWTLMPLPRPGHPP